MTKMEFMGWPYICLQYGLGIMSGLTRPESQETFAHVNNRFYANHVGRRMGTRVGSRHFR